MSKFNIDKRADSARERNGIGASLDIARATPSNVRAIHGHSSDPSSSPLARMYRCAAKFGGRWHRYADVQHRIQARASPSRVFWAKRAALRLFRAISSNRPAALRSFRASRTKKMLHFALSVPSRTGSQEPDPP